MRGYFVNNVFKTTWNETVITHFKIPPSFPTFPAYKVGRYSRKTQVRIAGLRAEIWTSDILNTNHLDAKSGLKARKALHVK
jgi:hypothetical protein